MTIPHYSKEAAVLEVNLFLQSGLDQLTTRVRFCVRFCTTVRRGVLYETIIFAHKDSSDVALCKTGENTGNNDQNLGGFERCSNFSYSSVLGWSGFPW